MKLDIYAEQYRSRQSYYQPGQLGTGSAKAITDTANTVVGALQKKREQDDEVKATQLYADTILEASKMQHQYEAQADPNNFREDIETQQQAIKDLIYKNSQLLKTPNAQNAFTQKMSTQLEPKYMGNVLSYSYNMQEEHYKNEYQRGNTAIDTLLLSGNSMMTVQEALDAKRVSREALATKFGIPQNIVQQETLEDNERTVRSYAYGMVTKDPYLVRGLMVGQGIEKFQAYKESIGESFTMEEFLTSDELRSEYSDSEFGAQFTDATNYLDFDARKDLFNIANQEIARLEKESEKAKNLANSKSDSELDFQRDAGVEQAKLDGTLPQSLLGMSKITSAEDPRLGTVGAEILAGKASKGPLNKGNKITEQGQTFANALDGKLRQTGYKTYVTSNLRPKDTKSMHKDGSAVDIQVFRDGKWNEQGFIEAYKTAVNYYGNNMRKGGTLFEVDPERLPYIKAALEAENIDTSFVNWEQSKTHGATAQKNKSQHIHFGIDKTADYSKTSSGKGLEFEFATQQGHDRYMQKMAEGADIDDCLKAAKEDEFKIAQAVENYTLINDLVTITNPDGTALDPALYNKALNIKKQQYRFDKTLSNEERVKKLTALANAEQEIPKLQELYRSDPIRFLLKTNQAKTVEEAIVLQSKRYGVSPENIVTIEDAEAETKANQLYSKFSGQEAVDYVKSQNPATLRQINKHMIDDSKSNMIMYSAAASPALTTQFIGAIQNWEDVQKAIKQDSKNFPTGWQQAVIGDFRKDPLMKTYLGDIEKTNPMEAVKLLDALSSVYAYRMSMGNDNKNKKEIIKDISRNIIGNNYSSATVSNPRFGSTQVNVANSLLTDLDSPDSGRNNLYKIQRTASMVSQLGIKDSDIYIGYDAANYGIQGIVGEALTDAQEQNKRHYLEGIRRTTKLTSSPDGLNGVFTWEDSKGRYPATTIKDKDTKNAFQVPYREMVQIYNEAFAIKERYAKGKGTQKHYSKKLGFGEVRITEAEAMDIALVEALTDKYTWLNEKRYGR